jgi:hypothetical protein
MLNGNFNLNEHELIIFWVVFIGILGLSIISCYAFIKKKMK